MTRFFIVIAYRAIEENTVKMFSADQVRFALKTPPASTNTRAAKAIRTAQIPNSRLVSAEKNWTA